jgi:hypothetical protein
VPIDLDGNPSDRAPSIPSFGSLRGPRRRSPVDLLVPGEPPAPVHAAPPAAPEPAARPAAPRPPEWSDLLHLGVHVGRAVVALPLRLVQRFLGR